MLRKDRFWNSAEDTEALAILVERTVNELYADGIPPLIGIIDYLEGDEDEVLP